MRPPRRSLLAILPLALAWFAVSAAPPARAGNELITVTTTDDELNTDGDCSLREAVVAANTNVAVDACVPGQPGHDVIDLPPGTYQLTIAGAGEDAAATGDLDVTESLAVDVDTLLADQGATIDGGGLDRIFDAADGVHSLSLRFITLRNGDAGAEDGGAIRYGDVCGGPAQGGPGNSGLVGVVFQDNHAASGGAIHVGPCHDLETLGVSFVGNSADASGGAISTDGSGIVSINNTTISGNSAGVSGGGIFGQMTVSFLSLHFVTLTANSAATGSAFAVDTADPMVVTSATVNNTLIVDNSGGAACVSEEIQGIGAASDDPSCLSDVLIVANAGVEPLANVGRYPVHMLALGSPARDTDPRSICIGDLAFDQLGNERPQDGDGDGTPACDAGAIEAAAVAPVSPSPSPSPLPDTATALPASGATHVPWLILAAALALSGVAARLRPVLARAR